MTRTVGQRGTGRPTVRAVASGRGKKKKKKKRRGEKKRGVDTTWKTIAAPELQ